MYNNVTNYKAKFNKIPKITTKIKNYLDSSGRPFCALK